MLCVFVSAMLSIFSYFYAKNVLTNNKNVNIWCSFWMDKCKLCKKDSILERKGMCCSFNSSKRLSGCVWNDFKIHKPPKTNNDIPLDTNNAMYFSIYNIHYALITHINIKIYKFSGKIINLYGRQTKLCKRVIIIIFKLFLYNVTAIYITNHHRYFT